MSTKNAYRLVNPYIEGSFDGVVRAKNSFSGGKKLYDAISGHFTNHLDNFYMTIQNIETKEITNFKIEEKRSNSSVVDYNLVKLDKKFSPELEKKLVTAIDKIETQTAGGKHKTDDSSDSSSSESDYYKFKFPVSPINRFVYFYMPYYKLDVVGLTLADTYRLFMPTFSLPINPVVELRLDFIL